MRKDEGQVNSVDCLPPFIEMSQQLLRVPHLAPRINLMGDPRNSTGSASHLVLTSNCYRRNLGLSSYRIQRSTVLVNFHAECSSCLRRHDLDMDGILALGKIPEGPVIIHCTVQKLVHGALNDPQS
jgi:hypothetical protein